MCLFDIHTSWKDLFLNIFAHFSFKFSNYWVLSSICVTDTSFSKFMIWKCFLPICSFSSKMKLNLSVSFLLWILFLVSSLGNLCLTKVKQILSKFNRFMFWSIFNFNIPGIILFVSSKVFLPNSVILKKVKSSFSYFSIYC